MADNATSDETYYESNLRDAWNAIKQGGYVVCSDIFDKIEPRDIIEIYDLKGLQIYRSFHGFQYWSYTMEELTSHPFYELFEPDLATEAAYATEFVRILSGQVESTYRLEIPAHIVNEKMSAQPFRTMLTPKYVSPLKDKDGRVVAFIHTVSAQRLEP